MEKVKKNVIFEGVDCVGKTTLIEKLSKKFFFLKKKRSAPINFEDGINKINRDFKLIKNKKKGLFFDRLHVIGEIIYGKYLRSSEKYKKHKYTKEINSLFKLNIELIFLYDDYKKIEKRFDYEFIKKKDIKVIQHRYKRLYWKIKKIKNINTNKIHFVNINNIKKIEEIILK